MNGPEHYKLAEDLLIEAEDAPTPEQTETCLRRAQLHATLALAAATALRGMNDMPNPEYDQWKKQAKAANIF